MAGDFLCYNQDKPIRISGESMSYAEAVQKAIDDIEERLDRLQRWIAASGEYRWMTEGNGSRNMTSPPARTWSRTRR